MTAPANDSKAGRLAFWLAFAGVAGILLYRWGIVLFAPPELLIATLPDDAFYYFGIAWNIAAGNGSSFDGLTVTNGYHPLWQMVLATVTLLVRAGEFTPEHGVFLSRVYVSLQLALSVIALAFTALALRTFGAERRSIALTVAFFSLPWLVYAMTDGMESGLVLLFLAAFSLAVARFRPLDGPAGTRDLALGSLFSMGVLARLDLVFFAAGMCGVLLATGWRRQGPGECIKRLLLWSGPVAVLLAVYLLLNRLHFDSSMPISGMLKNHFPTPTPSAAVLRGNLPFLVAGLLAAGCCLLVARRPATSAALRLLAAGGALFLGLHMVSTFVYTDWAVHTWHFTAHWFLLALFGPMAAAPLLRGRVLLPAVAVLLAAGIAGQWSFLSGRTGRAFQVRSHEAALWARANIPPGRLIGMTDCGAFGYFRGGLVVNLDGVVNNRAYQDELVDGGLASYLAGRDVRYIARHAVPAASVAPGYDTHILRGYSHLYNKPGGEIALRALDEVYRSEAYNDGRGEAVFLIWRINHAPSEGPPRFTFREPGVPPARAEDPH